jgi:hypothetical protein
VRRRDNGTLAKDPLETFVAISVAVFLEGGKKGIIASNAFQFVRGKILIVSKEIFSHESTIGQ